MMSIGKKKKTTEGEEAWSWVIEALASYKQIDTALLDDLASKSPCDYGSLSTSARERISLRALEELLSTTTTGADTTNSTPASSCIVVNVAEPAQDVLHRLHQKIKASSSGMAVLDSYKMDLHQFILQKRAGLPKCALQLLEDALTKGDHPSVKFLREESGLNKALDEEPAKELKQTTNDIRNLTPNANATRLVSGNLDNLLQKVPSADPSSSTRKKGRKVQFVDASKQSRKSGEFDQVNEITSPLVPGKRKRSEFTEDHLEDCLVSGEPIATEHDTVPLSSIQDEGINGTQGDLRGNREAVDGFGDLRDEAEAEPDAFVEDTESGSENHSNSERSHRNATLSRDPQDTDWTEDVSCLKCNKGDDLLICCGSTCQIAVHESCLGSSANVDDSGNFYCPFCSYSQAISAYREMKQKFVRAKEKVELAKNCLSKFVNVEHEATEKLASMERVESEEMNANGRRKEQVTDEGTTNSDLAPQQEKKLGEEETALTDKGLPQVDEPQTQIPSPVDRDVEETTGDENGDAKFEFRRRKLPVKPPCSSSSNSRAAYRRKPVPWSCQEEEKLKEGLDKYGCADAKWKKILEFGKNVFHESRTAIDLKDKWRNMDWSKFSKAGPRPRRTRKD